MQGTFKQVIVGSLDLQRTVRAYEISCMGNILKHYAGFATLLNKKCLNLEILHVNYRYHVHLLLLVNQLEWQFLQTVVCIPDGLQ